MGFQILLRESQFDPSSSLSEKLLVRYVRLLHRRSLLAIRSDEPTSYVTGGQARDISRLASKYLPTELIWEAVFDIYAYETENADDIPESSSSMPRSEEHTSDSSHSGESRMPSSA